MERQILNAVDAGDGDLEVRTLRQRVAAEPENLTVRLELAALYGRRGYPELALEHCRLAAARFPDSGEAELGLMKALRDMHLRQEAAATLAAFLTAHPQTAPEYESWLGILRDEMGLWKPGEQAHRAALALAPQADYLHNNLGYNLLLQGRQQEAAAEFQEALRLNPHSTLARNNLGLAIASRPENAIRQWESATDPATAHSNLAALYIEQGNYAEARKELAIALGYNKTHSAALNNLRLVSRLDGKPASLPPASRPGEKRRTWLSSLRWYLTSGEQAQPRAAEDAAPANTRRGL